MFKTLLRKQLEELLSPVLIDRKKNQKRSKNRAILFGLLFAFCFVALASAFVGLSLLMADYLLVIPELHWLYFTLAGIITLVLGIFGSIFATYSMLYQAKDNELLLSMPLTPSSILLTRMLGVYGMGFLFAALVWIPAVVVYAIKVHPGFVPILISALMLFVFSFVILTLSCLLGWVVALIASRVKNKNVVVTLLTILGVGGYYYLSFNLQTLLEGLLQKGDILAASIRENAWPLYEIGQAAQGDIGAFLLCLAFSLVLGALTWFVLSKTFFKIVTTKRGGKKAVYKEGKAVERSADNALLRKEFRRFTSSPAYMLNCGLGCLIMPVLAVLLLVRGGNLREILNVGLTEWPPLIQWMPLFCAAVLLFAASLNNATAPSISLEAKNLWIVKSMPVDINRFLDAKQKMSILLTLPPILFLSIAGCIMLPMDLTGMILLVIFAILVTLLNSVWGLTMNLKLPNMHWVNETAAVKSGASVVLGLFGSWIFALVCGVLAYFLRNAITPTAYMICVMAVMLIGIVLLNLWVRKRGPEIIAEL